MNITKNIESLSLVVQWDAVEDFIDTIYTVLWSSETNPIPRVAVVTEQASYTITGLTLDTVYTLTISTANMCGNGLELTTSILFDNTSTISSISLTVTASTSTNSMTTAFNSKSSTIITTATATTVNKTPDAASKSTGTNVSNTTAASITTIITLLNTATNIVVYIYVHIYIYNYAYYNVLSFCLLYNYVLQFMANTASTYCIEVLHK